uniref:Uncharacterized protein n=1 Tax=Gallus gallus TaxID=9031 RepID=A0A8V0YZQ8_CHICK
MSVPGGVQHHPCSECWRAVLAGRCSAASRLLAASWNRSVFHSKSLFFTSAWRRQHPLIPAPCYGAQVAACPYGSAGLGNGRGLVVTWPQSRTEGEKTRPHEPSVLLVQILFFLLPPLRALSGALKGCRHTASLQGLHCSQSQILPPQCLLCYSTSWLLH